MVNAASHDLRKWAKAGFAGEQELVDAEVRSKEAVVPTSRRVVPEDRPPPRRSTVVCAWRAPSNCVARASMKAFRSPASARRDDARISNPKLSDAMAASNS